MKLVIVESPTKAKKIESVLGSEYKAMASYGHICDLAKGGKFGIGIDVKNNFKPKYVLMDDKVDVLQSIINEAEKADEIIILRDEDKEGCAIAYHIKRYLQSSNKPIRIGTLHEITEKGIRDALKSLEPEIDMNLFHSQEARRILDRIVGFMVSPYLMANYGNNLSAGRVQSVAVRMISDREKEIEIFKPEEFWSIFVKFKNANDENFAAKFQGRPTNKQSADAITTLIKNEQEFLVHSVKRQTKKENPPPPMTTAALQQFMAKKHSFDPDRTMKSAQSLYENGFCTYIRTDSTRISDEAIKPVRELIVKLGFSVPKKPNKYEAKATAQDAHECIRPTNVNGYSADMNILVGDEKLVYDVIWKHFLASQMNQAVWNTLQVVIQARLNKKLAFVASGKALESPGYLEIFAAIDKGKIEIPNLVVGDILSVVDMKSEQKFTQPPPRYNDASILKELENKQIGRPSTWAEIIKKIDARNYVEKNGNTYKITELGRKITDILASSFDFLDYDYSSDLEKKLDNIADGSVKELDMLNEFFVPFKEKLDLAYMSAGAIECDRCKSPMIKRTNSQDQSQFWGCTNRSNCYNTVSITQQMKAS